MIRYTVISPHLDLLCATNTKCSGGLLKVNKFSNIIVYLCESQVYRQILSLDIDSIE